MGAFTKARDFFLDRIPVTERRLGKEFANRLPPVIRSWMGNLGIDFSKFFSKDARTVVPELLMSRGEFIEPPYDPETLQLAAERHWVVRLCIDKLVRESTRKGWHFEPNFGTRCASCGSEYEYTPLSEACPECNGELEKPDPSQLVAANEWLSNPNPSHTTSDIVKRAIHDLLVFDDFYASMTLSSAGYQMWPEDARFIRPIVDARARLGGKTFCPRQQQQKKPGEEVQLYPSTSHPPGSPCPENDGEKLLEAGYVQRVGSNVVAAFTPDEMMHGNLWATGSRLFGTPKLWAVQAQLTAMQLIDVYQKDSFDKGKTPKNIYLVKGIAEDAWRRAMLQHEQAKKLNPQSDFWIPVPPRLEKTGGEIGIDHISGIESPLIQGSLAFQEYYFRAICYTFGVSPASIGMETTGKLGASQAGAEQRDVTPETINEIQVQVSETFDRFIKKFFSMIVDWHWSLVSAHEDEETKIWTLKKLQTETAKIAVDAGFDVVIDEDGTPKISGAIDEETRQAKRDQNREDMEARFGQAKQPVEKAKDDDLEKASKFQAAIKRGAKLYKERLDALAESIFSAANQEIVSVLTATIPGQDRVDMETRDVLLTRIEDSFNLSLTQAESIALESARDLFRIGNREASEEVGKIAKQETPDQAAIDAHRARTIAAMRNILYFGDKDSYLTKIKGLIDRGIEENWTVSKLAIELQRELDPEKEHFSNYMWERIARTESAAYVIDGRLSAYREFDIPKVRRIVTLDERTDPINCAPFSNAIYKIEDANDVVPAHPNCRCAFAPYMGDEEPLADYQIIRNQ